MESRVENVLKQWNQAVSHALQNSPEFQEQTKSNPSNCNESQEKHKCMRPWEYSCFLHRLNTFSPSTWFGKPATVSKQQCASRGWENTEWDTLHCNVCQTKLRWENQNSEIINPANPANSDDSTRSNSRKKNVDEDIGSKGEDFISTILKLDQESKLAEEFALKLENAHSKYCPWYRIDSSVIDHLLSPGGEYTHMDDLSTIGQENHNDGDYIYSSVRNHLNKFLGV